MEELGYILSKSDPNDGRKVILELTDDGKKATQHFSVLDYERIVQIFEKMTSNEIQCVLDGLRLFAEYAIKS